MKGVFPTPDTGSFFPADTDNQTKINVTQRRRKIGEIGGGRSRSRGVRDHAEHIKMGVDWYFYGGPGGKAPGSYQFFNKKLA